MGSIRFEMSFADKSIKIDNNAFMDILEAFNSAKLNLKARHECEVHNLCLDQMRNNVTGVITLLDGLSMDEFKIGYHLRGVSLYLCKKWPDKYRKVGNRLFNYIRIDNGNPELYDFENQMIIICNEIAKEFMGKANAIIEKTVKNNPNLTSEELMRVTNRAIETAFRNGVSQ